MPPMCQEKATVERFQNMEVMMKIGPRQTCRQGHQTLHLFPLSHLSVEMGEGMVSEESSWILLDQQ